MANKKVSQLSSKPSVLVTDLFPIADPSTGQLYKTTISDLGTAIGSGVSSVNGLVGAVVLDTDDIQELVSPTNKWFTDTRARAALSASSPLAYNSGTGVFSIPAATSSQNGYLTSTDWTTFNSKISGSGISGRYARFTGSDTIADGFIETTGNITYVEGLGLSTLNGLEITGNFGGGSGGLKLKSYDETTGKAYMEFFNTSGNFRLGLEGSTGGGVLPGSTAYATVLTTGLTAKNLEFGTNNAKRLTLDGTTGNATFESSVGIGTSSLTGYNLRVSKNITGAVTAYGITSDSIVQSDVTSSARGFESSLGTQAATFTLPFLYHYRAIQGAFGSGSTVTSQYGFIAESTLIGATNNFGFHGNIAAGTNRWNFYAAGTASNFFAGSVGIGGTFLGGVNLSVNKNIIGGWVGSGSFGANIYATGAVQSDVTSTAHYFVTRPSTAATTFTVNTLNSYTASNATRGAGSTINNLIGFSVEAAHNVGTNNYAFSGALAAATNTWNLYMAGTADNYLAGSLGIGVTPGTKLHVFNSSTGVLARFNSSGSDTRFSANSGVFDINTTGSSFAISTSSVERLRVNAAGNLLIGSTADNGSKLQVTGAATFSSTSNVPILIKSSSGSNTSYLYSANAGSSSDYQVAYGSLNNDASIVAGGSTKMTITSTGNVGIGTTAPTDYSGYTTLHLNGKSGGNGGVLRLTAYDSTSSANIYAGGSALNINTTTAVPIKFLTRDTVRMQILDSGAIIGGHQLGNQYSMTSGGGTGTSIVDTGITYNSGDYGGYGRGVTYQVVFNGNPNGNGSAAYFAQYMGIIIIYTGYSGSAVTTYIQYTQLAGGNNIGALTLTPVFWNGSTESSSIGVYTTGAQIRLKISGYNSSVTGQDQSVYLTRIS